MSILRLADTDELHGAHFDNGGGSFHVMHKRFGASNTKTGAENRTAIQAAIDAAGAFRTISFHGFNGNVEGTLLFDSGQLFEGGSATIIQTGGAVRTLVPRTQGVTRTTFPAFRNLTINNSDSTLMADEAGMAIDLRHVSHFTVDNCSLRFWGAGIAFGKYASDSGGYYNKIKDTEIASCKYGLRAYQSGNSVEVDGGRILSCKYGFRSETGVNDIRLHTAFESCYWGVYCGGETFGVQIGGRFEGNNDTRTITVLTRSGTTVTATSASHRLDVGDEIIVAGADQAEYNGVQTVASVIDSTQFTFTISGSPATPATGTITFNMRLGGAILFESGAERNTITAYRSSGSADRVIDLDGRNIDLMGHGVSGVAGSSGAPLLSNGDVSLDSDSDGLADGLTLSASLPAGMTLDLDTAVFDTGINSQHIEIATTGSSRRDLLRALRVVPGVPYIFVARVRTDKHGLCSVRLGSTSGGIDYLNVAVPNTGGFVTISERFIPTTAVVHVTFFMHANFVAASAAGSNFWIDSYSLVAGLQAPVCGEAPRVIMPSYTTANLPANPVLGETVLDLTLGYPVTYNGSAWVSKP